METSLMTVQVAISSFLGIYWWVWTIILTQAYLVWSYWHPRLWVPVDVARIKGDGSDQSLTNTFHRQRLTWRLIGAVVPAILTGLGVLLGMPSKTWFCVELLGLLGFAGGYWMWYFNPALNVARKEDYIGPFHVSWAADASYLDRTIWREAWEKVHLTDKSHQFDFIPGERDEAVIPIAAELYEDFLNWCKLAGGITFFLTHFLLFLRIWQLTHFQLHPHQL